MALSVSDGSLEFSASINTDEFAAAQKKIEASLQEIAATATETSKRSENAFKNLIPEGLNSAEIDAVIEKIQQLQDEELRLQKAIEGTNDKNALSAYKAALDEVGKKLDAAPAELYKTVLKEVEAQMVKTSQSVAGLFEGNTAETSAGISEMGDKAQKVSARIREITNELIGLDKGSPKFNALITEAANLTDELGDTRAQIRLLASDTSKLDAGIEVVQGLAGVFAAAQGAMALFGNENEDFQKTLIKVNAAMAILQGAQQVGNLLDKNSALNVAILKALRTGEAEATQLQAAATEELAVAEGEAAIAQEGLNVAMEANPAGVILLAITALVAAYQFLSSQIKDVTEEQTKLNDALAKANETLLKIVESETQGYQQRTKAAADALSLAEAQGKSENELLDLKNKEIAARKLENVYTLARLGYDRQSLGLAQAQLDSYNDQIQGLQNIITLGGELNKDDTKRLALLESQKKALEVTYNPGRAAFDAITSADAEAANLRAEQAKKAHDDALKSAGAEADARLIAAKKNSKEELNARIADIKEQAKIELDNVNLTSGERKKILEQERKDIADATRAFNILQLTNQRELINAQLDTVAQGSKEELSLRIDLINQTAAIERAQEGISQERKIAIQAAAAKQISDLTKKYLFENQEIELNTIVSGINTRLSTVEVGSREELELKKQLIDQKASLDVVSALKSIDNEKLRVAKIKDINAKARQDQKKADDSYYDNLLKDQITQIEQANSFSSISLNKTVNDPTSGAFQKLEAQKQLIVNEINTVQQEINLVGNNIIKNRGDAKTLEAQLSALELKKAQLQGALDATSNNERVESIKQFAKWAGTAASSFGAIGDAVAGFNAGLADTLNTMSELANAAANVATAIASHDPAAIAAASINAVSTVIKIFSASKESARKAQEELIAYQQRVIDGEINVNLIYRDRQRQQVEINKLRIQGINAENDLLKQQQAQQLADYNRIFSLIQQQSKVIGEHTEKSGGFLGIGRKTNVVQDLGSLAGSSYDDLEKLFNSGALTDKAKALFEELQKLKQEGVDIDKALEDNKAQAAELFTGTTSDNILDSIVQGFADGKRATADFADNFQDLMKKAILNSLKYQALEKPLKDFYEQFSIDAESDNVLSQSEIDKLKSNYNEIITNAGKKFDELQKITQVNFNSLSSGNNSLSGAIKGISAAQADLLAGQFGGMRLSNLEILGTANKQLLTLNKIENNTAAAVQVMSDYYRQWSTLGLKVNVA